MSLRVGKRSGARLSRSSGQVSTAELAFWTHPRRAGQDFFSRPLGSPDSGRKALPAGDRRAGLWPAPLGRHCRHAAAQGDLALGPTRTQLIDKGMAWSPRTSPSHGDTAFTAPMFDEFLKRFMPEQDWLP